MKSPYALVRIVSSLVLTQSAFAADTTRLSKTQKSEVCSQIIDIVPTEKNGRTVKGISKEKCMEFKFEVIEADEYIIQVRTSGSTVKDETTYCEASIAANPLNSAHITLPAPTCETHR